MITKVNSSDVNFKGFSYDKNCFFSEKQIHTIKDIKNKLGDNAHQQDYFISSGAVIDTVALWKFDNKNKKTYIGAYDDKTIFNIEDCEKGISCSNSNIRKFAGFAIGVATLLASALLIGKFTQASAVNNVKTTINVLK